MAESTNYHNWFIPGQGCMFLKRYYFIVVFYTVLFLLFLTAAPASVLAEFPMIRGLASIVLKQQIPEGSNVSRSFYANNVQLEPFSIILCGKKVEKDDGSITYTKVPAEAIKYISFYTQPDLALDQKYNPGNHIPVIGGLSSRAYSSPYKMDSGEPLFSKEEADRRRVLLVYTENSNYFHLYNKKGFHLGGISAAFPLMSFMSTDAGNECYAEQRPGIGETVVRLYLLATKGLNNTPLLKLCAKARLDDEDKMLPEEEGPLRYALPASPRLTIEDIDVQKLTYSVGPKKHGSFYSFFSALVKSKKRYGVIEQKGLRVCGVLIGAPFHNLFRYTDDARLCSENYEDDFLTGRVADCFLATCKRTVSLSAISSKKIPFVDMFSGSMVVGARCSNRSMGTGGGLVLKPLLNGTVESLMPGSPIYESITGGVGAHFYLRRSKKDTFRPMNKGAEAGRDNVFYYYSYQWGESAAGMMGIGASCKWDQGLKAEGHDLFGNQVLISFNPALGNAPPVITGVSN